MKRSDIDIGVVAPRANLKDWEAVLSIIDEADTLLEVDCVRIDAVSNEDLRKNIEAEAVAL